MKVRVIISYDFSDEQRAECVAENIESGIFDGAVQEADGVYRATREELKSLIRTHGEPRQGNGNYHELMSFP